jgi:TPR repeat protein
MGADIKTAKKWQGFFSVSEYCQEMTRKALARVKQTYNSASAAVALAASQTLSVTLLLSQEFNPKNPNPNVQACLSQVTPASKAGEPLAQFITGVLHVEGHAGRQPENLELGRALLQTLAYQNEPLALNYLGGSCYQKKKYTTAFRHFKDAADAGDLRARKNVGLMYWQGKGVPQNFSLAMTYLKAAGSFGKASLKKLRAQVQAAHADKQVASQQDSSKKMLSKHTSRNSALKLIAG